MASDFCHHASSLKRIGSSQERGKDPEIKSTLEAALSRVQDPKHELVDASNAARHLFGLRVQGLRFRV